MSFRDKIVVVTGGGSGIGKALCHAFAREGATVVVVDLVPCQAFTKDLATVGGNNTKHSTVACDVTNAFKVRSMIRNIKETFGKIDVYCSNAGRMLPPPARGDNNYDDSVARHSDEQWTQLIRLHLQSHVMAARELLPDWENKNDAGDGIFVVTASAAGLLTQIGDTSYGVTKAAAVSFCEHMAIAHTKVRVHCLCPQAVDTPLVQNLSSSWTNSAMADGMLRPEDVAKCTLDAIRNREFWVFPHPHVKWPTVNYVRRKSTHHSRPMDQRHANIPLGPASNQAVTAAEIREQLHHSYNKNNNNFNNTNNTPVALQTLEINQT